MTNLYPQERWNTSYSNRPVKLANHNDPIIQLLHTYIPSQSGEAIEIGCCPGTFLGHLSLMGYRIHGIDLAPSVHHLEEVYRQLNLNVGKFEKKCFFDFSKTTDMRYDVVTSFGFIEHFTNYEEVFFLHCRLVNKKGYICVTFPNYIGHLQFALHSIFDEENMKRHNLRSMNLPQYTKMLQALKFKILFSGFFGGFRFWRGSSGDIPHSPALRALFAAVNELSQKQSVIGESPSWSCYGGIVAQKM